jgi:hypothetical protein
MDAVEDRELERQGLRMGRSGSRFLLLGIPIAIVGIVLIVVGVTGLGIAILLIGGIPGTVGVALILSSAVARWSARHKLFA